MAGTSPAMTILLTAGTEGYRSRERISDERPKAGAVGAGNSVISNDAM
jgi:hypothetical protein